jgi:putative phosphoesterase
MRIGILSDTHDQLVLTRQAVDLLIREGAEALIHCGDMTGPDIVRACAKLPCTFAFGNHDADNVPALERAIVEVGGTCVASGGIVELAGKRIAVLHGHVGMKAMLARTPDYLVHGHSHIAANARIGVTRRICPGALDRADSLTVAILDTESGELRFLRLSGEAATHTSR